jgi:Right handed beta helix region
MLARIGMINISIIDVRLRLLTMLSGRNSGFLWLCGLLMNLLFLSGIARATITLRVSPKGPLKSLTQARDAIRIIKSKVPLKEPVVVVIDGGTYWIKKPVVFNAVDSGGGNAFISYVAAPGVRPIFNGGRLITGWTKCANGLWKAQAGKKTFEQLWVNGTRAVRAREPNDFYYYAADRAKIIEGAPLKPSEIRRSAFIARKEDVAELRKLDKKQLNDVVVTVYHAWEVSRHRILSIGSDGTLYLSNGMHRSLFNWGAPRFSIENFKSALDAPGEWFLDRKGIVYYRPRNGEDMTNAEVIAPVTDKFFIFAGIPENKQFVERMIFKGLTFLYAGSKLPDKGEGNHQAAAGIEAQIVADGARNLIFEDCEIAHNSLYGFWFRRGCSNNKLVHCLIHDMGAGGIRIGDITIAKDSSEVTNNTLIDNCIIQEGGRIFPGAVGIWIGHSSDNRVTHNDIGDLFYSGISIGWSWGYKKSPAKNNCVQFNRIHNIGQGVLSDMGGIYTLGLSEGTKISNNIIHDVYSYSYGGWGIYLDQGSSGITISNNLVYNVKSADFNLNYGKDNLVANNIFAYGRENQIALSRPDSDLSLILRKNIVFYEEGTLFGGQWNDEGVLVRDNLYWDTSGKVDFMGKSFNEWQKEGHDIGSIIADPLFIDARKYDFRLQRNTPARKIGFIPFDYAIAGVYGDKNWNLRASSEITPELRQPPPLPPEKPLIVKENFDLFQVNEFPEFGAKLNIGSRKSIAVTDRYAKSGTRCLKIVNSSHAGKAFYPYFYFDPHYANGQAYCSFYLRLPLNADFVHQWRETAKSKYIGPNFRIQKCQLRVNDKEIMSITPNTWVRFEILAGLGDKADGRWELHVTLPGTSPKVFNSLKCNKKWKSLDWIGFISYAKGDSACYLDNLNIRDIK